MVLANRLLGSAGPILVSSLLCLNPLVAQAGTDSIVNPDLDIISGHTAQSTEVASTSDIMYPTTNLSSYCDDGIPCQTDSRWYDFYRHSSLNGTNFGGTAGAQPFQNMGDGSDMETSEIGYSNMDPKTVDAYMVITQLGTSTAARASCKEIYVLLSPYVCQSFRLYIDEEASGGTWNWAKALTCHEMGHTVGIVHGERAYPALSNTHSDLGCVRTPASESVRSLGTYVYSQINATY